MGDSEQLILQKEEEKLLVKIDRLKGQSLMAEQLRSIEREQEIFSVAFLRLCWLYERLNGCQLSELDDRQLFLLGEYLLKKSALRKKIEKLVFLVPVFGWFMLLDYFSFREFYVTVASQFSHSRGRLKKYLGENYFPVQKIREKLRGYWQPDPDR